MKKSLLLAVAVFAAASFLSSCSKDGQSINGPGTVLPLSAHGGGGGSSTAHPAWTFEGSTTVKKSIYFTVAVSDSDGSNNTNVYTAPSADVTESGECWSATGGSISFIEHNGSTNSIKAVDVTVNSDGVPVGSNERTIYSTSMTIHFQAWCPNSSIGEIAFIASSGSSWGVYTVSTSGGTPTLLYNVSSNLPGWVTWSNDGSELAFWNNDQTTSPVTFSLKVIDASSGTVNASLVSGSYVDVSGLEWSHSGTDLLAYTASTTNNSSNTFDVYTIGTSSGSTPSSALADGAGPVFWSPNNSELLYDNESSGTVTTKFDIAKAATTTVGSSVPYGDWK